ncbi:AbrB/MazE/SpoVT family DNA-binding domain-containing protein [Nanoarchaeota archaeon]
MVKVERKLQQISGSLLVSLPKEWTKQYKLKRGSKLQLEMEYDGSLKIAPKLEEKQKIRKIVINFDQYFARRFFKYYVAGYDYISIKFKNIPKAQKDSLYRFLKKFMNVQIIEESKEKIVIQNFKLEGATITTCFNRMNFLVSNMFDELLTTNNTNQINELDNSISLFYYMLIMQAREYLEYGKYTKAELSIISTMDYRMGAEKVERIGDVIKNLSKNKLNKEVIEFAKLIVKEYKKAVNSFINKEFEKAVELWEDMKTIKQHYQKTKNKLIKSNDIKSIEQLNDLMQIMEYAKDIANLVK